MGFLNFHNINILLDVLISSHITSPDHTIQTHYRPRLQEIPAAENKILSDKNKLGTEFPALISLTFHQIIQYSDECQRECRSLSCSPQTGPRVHPHISGEYRPPAPLSGDHTEWWWPGHQLNNHEERLENWVWLFQCIMRLKMLVSWSGIMEYTGVGHLRGNCK